MFLESIYLQTDTRFPARTCINSGLKVYLVLLTKLICCEICGLKTQRNKEKKLKTLQLDEWYVTEHNIQKLLYKQDMYRVFSKFIFIHYIYQTWTQSVYTPCIMHNLISAFRMCLAVTLLWLRFMQQQLFGHWKKFKFYIVFQAEMAIILVNFDKVFWYFIKIFL